MTTKPKFQWTFEKKLYIGLLPFIPIGTICAIFYDKLVSFMERYRPICGIYYRFHIYCPGCGGTRAIGALIHGHLIQSFLYHPIIPILIIMYITFMVSHTISIFYPKYYGIEIKPSQAIFIVTTIILNFIIRNILLLLGLPTFL